MPGTDPAEAMRVIADELPEFPYLPELPDRGPGADLIGRTAGLLIDIPVEVTPRGWRLAERPGRDLSRARSLLSSDLDVMAEVLDGYTGLVKIQLCGPWTLAAALERPRSMNAALSDPGAVADLTASLAEGAGAGRGLLTGAVPALPDAAAEANGPPSARDAGRRDGARETAERVIRLYQRLGLPLATCAKQAVITPSCGLAGASAAQARAALTRCHQAASMLAELIEDAGGEPR